MAFEKDAEIMRHVSDSTLDADYDRRKCAVCGRPVDCLCGQMPLCSEHAGFKIELE